MKKPDNREISNQTRKLPLKLEVKFDIKYFGTKIDAEKLNQWLKQLEVFFRVQKVEYDREKIEISTQKIERHALV